MTGKIPGNGQVSKSQNVNKKCALIYLSVLEKNFFTKSCPKLNSKKIRGKKWIEKNSARKKIARIIMKFTIGVQKKILRLFCQVKKIDLFCKKWRKSSLKS